MKTTPETKEAIRNYILQAIDFSGHEKYKGVQMSERDRIRTVFEIFKSEYGHNLKRYKNEQTTFENWLQGLPSVFNIDFEDDKIIQINKQWGFLRKNASEKEEQQAIKLWWGRIYMEARKILNQKPYKVKTIDVNALEWWDKVNGNSYFAATVILNYGKPKEKRIILPFQYGYGEHYVSEAGKELDSRGYITLERYPNGNTEMLRTYCEREKIILRRSKQTGCKKSELKAFH